MRRPDEEPELVDLDPEELDAVIDGWIERWTPGCCEQCGRPDHLVRVCPARPRRLPAASAA